MIQQALYAISNGIYVLGAVGNKGFVGSIIDAVSQVAVTPNLIIISCSNTSYTKECIEQSGEFSLSVLPKEVDPYIVATFGYQSSRMVDKWAQVNYDKIDCLPYIPNALAKIRARVKDKLEYPCNTVFVAEVIDAYDVREGEPLTYKYYREEFKNLCREAFDKNNMTAAPVCTPTQHVVQKKRWVCTLCEYVYDGDIPFEELPDDWRCPLCGVGKELFELRTV